MIREVFTTVVEIFPRKFFINGDAGDNLGFRNRFKFSEGIQGFSIRGAGKLKYGEKIKNVVTPTLCGTYGAYLILSLLRGDVEAWIYEKIVEVILPGVPFPLVKILILLLLLLLLFGGNTILRKIPGKFYAAFLNITYGSDAEKLKVHIENEYKRWESVQAVKEQQLVLEPLKKLRTVKVALLPGG